ncbi:MAG: DNA polymerase III subunit gamma/tau [Thermodesulfobacteriota bacterium]
MSYLVLARKWRPLNFDQVVGQGPIVRILRNAISRNRVPHAMLFSGVRGVGKTTLARIMAKALNCERQGGELPCNECSSCLEIMAGTAVDLHEIDGASNRGIQEIRDLKENIRFLPTRGRYKIMIIDEVHMLTNEAFNALLKTLEEPPDHVIFMFATTEIHKIPVTILSRCQRYELKRIPFAELFGFFKKIAEAEKTTIFDSALEMIAREAAGSVRDGLSLLDQVFSFGGEQMTDEDVSEVLGLVGSQVFEQLAAALLAEDLGAALKILDQVCTAGADLKRFTADLLQFIRGLIVCRVSKAPAELLEGSDREIASMTEMAGRQSSETLYSQFDLLLKGAAEMQFAPHPRLVLEMTFAKIVQAGQLVPVSSLIARIDELLAAGGGEAPPISQTAAIPTPEKKKPEPLAPTPVAPVRLAEPAVPFKVQSQHGVVPPDVETDEPGPGLEEAVMESTAAAPKDIRKDWDDFVAYVKDRKDWMAQIVKMCDSVRLHDGELLMRYDDASQCPILQQSDNLKILTEFAQDFFQQEWRVKVSANSAGGSQGGGEGTAGLQEERVALRRDPLALLVAEVFNGYVGDVRTGPRSREIKAGMEEEK